MRWFVIFLSIFLLLFGLFSVTTIGVDYGKQIMGFSAAIAGIIGVICVVRGQGPMTI